MTDDPDRASEVVSRMLPALLNAFLTVQALHVAPALGIPDLLADAPATADSLAVGSRCASALAVPDCCACWPERECSRGEADGRFSLTVLGRHPPK